MRRFEKIASFAVAGALTFGAGAGAAVANTQAQAPAEPLPSIATSVVTITASAPTEAARAEQMGMATEGAATKAPIGYSYVVYFPAGEAALTLPAQATIEAVADEVTDMQLSNVTLTAEDGLNARSDVVRAALIENGVPERWIAIQEKSRDGIGPVSMVAR